MTEPKEFWRSKTFWASVATVVLPLLPPVAVFRAANPQVYDSVVALVFGGVLRTATIQPISWRLRPKNGDPKPLG